MNWIVPYLALTAGQTLDAASTHRALTSGRCVEANAGIYGRAPNVTRLITTKAAVTGSSTLVGAWVLKKTGHETAARRLGYIGGIAGAGAGVWNLKTCK